MDTPSIQECIFCKIVRGEIPSRKEYEDEEILVFHDINPHAPVHLLVVPKKHIPRLAEAREEDVEILGRCQLVSAEVAKKLGIGDAFRVLNSSGAGAGQDVFHIHYHVLGGWEQAPQMQAGKDFP